MAITKSAAAAQRRKRDVLKSLGKLGDERTDLRAKSKTNRDAILAGVHDGHDADLTLKEMGEALGMSTEAVRLFLERPRPTPRQEEPAPRTNRGGRPRGAEKTPA